MTFVFNLSKPLDFYPIYDFLAIELFELENISILKNNIDKFSKKFNKDNFIIVENEVRQYSQIVRDVIFLPELSFFEKMFLICAFINSQFFDPKVVVISGNVVYENIDRIFKSIDNLLQDEFLYSYPLLFFGGENGNFTTFIEKSEHENINQFYFFKRFAGQKEYETNKERFLGFAGFYYFHSIKLKEIFCSNENIAHIYFMAESAWKLEEKWESVIENLKKINIVELITKENPILLKLDSNIKFYNKTSDLLDFFDTDENKNIIRGKVNIENVKNSIIINNDNVEIFIKNKSNTLVLAQNGYIRVENISIF